MPTMRLNLIRGCAALSLAFILAPVGAGAATQWQGYTYAPAALASYQGLERLAEQLAQTTDGELAITVSPGGSMPIKGDDIAQAVGAGIVQLGGTGGYAGYVPIGGIGRLPMLYETAEEFDRAYEILEPYLEKALAEKNVTLIGHYRYPVQTVWSRTPIDSLDDMAGVNFRIVSPEQAAAVQRLGAVPVSMSTPDVASSLQRGAIEMLLTASAGGGKLWYEMLDTNYQLPVNWSLSLILVNRQAFEALDPEVQAQVREAGAEAGTWITQRFEQEEEELTGQFQSEGLNVVEPTPEQIAEAREVVRPYWDEWADQQGAGAQEVLAKIRQALDK